IDFGPQPSLTMFLGHENSVGLVENAAAQAMLKNVSGEELLSDFIVSSFIPDVDVIPASINDAFLGEGWKRL
ncbi:ParA family protein, partial [Salmonella enterica]|uniref:ParA family protein n=1 Tax=Salmonella enterica TaxID=28901 RepID=UPI000A7388F0